jgi:AbrB family looped-hinge helix DNA binding protein
MYMHDKKLFGTATVGSKGQVVIPVEAREKLNINVGDKLYVLGSEKGGWAGFIKEDKLAEIVGHLVDNIEMYKEALGDKEK